MNNFSTPSWGYKILSDNLISFYHTLSSKVNVDVLFKYLTHVQYLKLAKDGSILISIPKNTNPLQVVEEILSFFNTNAQDFLDTPIYYYKYKISSPIRQHRKEWALSLEGCIALLLINNKKVRTLIDGNWEFINSPIGGIFLSPYTLLFYEDYPKIIHPITAYNYKKRDVIEQEAARFVGYVLKTIDEAYPGYEGRALLSIVTSHTNLVEEKIITILNKKTIGVKNPHYNPLVVHLD